MMIFQRKPREKRGFTLVEASIVLAIASLVLGGIWVAASSVSSNQKVNKAYTQIVQIVQNIRDLYAAQPSLDATLNFADQITQLIERGAIPKDMVSGASDADSPWGKNVRVLATTDGNAFTVFYRGVPQDACINLVTRIAAPGHDGGLGLGGLPTLAQAETGPTRRPNLGVLISADGVSPTANATGCTNDAANGNLISFTFSLRG